jgi:hypothetical protein
MKPMPPRLPRPAWCRSSWFRAMTTSFSSRSPVPRATGGCMIFPHASSSRATNGGTSSGARS